MDKEIATKPLNLNLELNGIGIERGTKIENIRKQEDMAPGPATFILAHLLYLTLAAHLHSHPAQPTRALVPTAGSRWTASLLSQAAPTSPLTSGAHCLEASSSTTRASHGSRRDSSWSLRKSRWAGATNRPKIPSSALGACPAPIKIGVTLVLQHRSTVAVTTLCVAASSACGVAVTGPGRSTWASAYPRKGTALTWSDW